MAFRGENALLAGATGAPKKSSSASRSELFDMGIIEPVVELLEDDAGGRATGECVVGVGVRSRTTAAASPFPMIIFGSLSAMVLGSTNHLKSQTY